jgi:integrator complex subunit 6
LKNLQATGLTTAGPALKQTFDLLNVNRMTSGIDTYGQGRFPFYLEPAVIVCVTDGRKLTTNGSVQNELNLPMNNMVPGSELTKEPFRWDQRLFALMLRIPAVPPGDNMMPFIPPADDSPIDAMCEVTGGRSYNITSYRSLMQCLDSLVQKVQTGVVINFEKIGPDPTPIDKSESEKDSSIKENLDANIQSGQQLNDKSRPVTPTLTNTAWHSCRKQIYVPRSAQKGYSVGHWPIPEAFWPDLNSPALPPRSAHPTVKFACTPCDPMAVENIAFDKYELEPSPLTQYVLERAQPSVAWQVFVSNSAKYSDIGHPFGYLKAGTSLKTVNLIVMPYNYPVLLPLLDELFKVHKLKPTQKWRQQFDNYLKTMPVYYAQPLRRALGPRLANLVPDQLENCLSYSVVSYLKKLKNQAKMEYERLVMSVGQKGPTTEPIKVTPRNQTSLLQRKDFNQLLQHYGGDMAHLKQELNEFTTFTIATLDKNVKPNTFR